MRLRVAAFGAAVCVLALLGVLATPAREAHACSLVPFGHQLLPAAVESSSTIAVGRLAKAARDVITLEVEEGMKGTRAGERLTVNNAALDLGADCSVSLQPDGKGFALPEGSRVLAFLQANELGGPAALRSALFGHGVFTLDGEFIQSAQPASDLPTLEQVRAAVRGAGVGPGSPATRPATGTPGSTDKGRDNLWLSVAVVAGLGTFAAVAGYVLVRRRRR